MLDKANVAARPLSQKKEYLSGVLTNMDCRGAIRYPTFPYTVVEKYDLLAPEWADAGTGAAGAVVCDDVSKAAPDG